MTRLKTPLLILHKGQLGGLLTGVKSSVTGSYLVPWVSKRGLGVRHSGVAFGDSRLRFGGLGPRLRV